MSYTEEEEYREIEKMTDHAIEHRHYKVHCNGMKGKKLCYNSTEENEYGLSAAEEAYNEGYRTKEFDGETLVFCPRCLEERWWKEYEDEV